MPAAARRQTMLLSILLLACTALAEVAKEKSEERSTLRIRGEEFSSESNSHDRRLLVSGGSCACVCAGTHEGYVQVNYQSGCTSSVCVGAFPSCSWGETTAVYSDGTLPTGKQSGVMVLQTSQPPNCQQALIGATCSEQYQFGVNAGFIQLVSTSSDACVPGSAQQSVAYKTKNTLAAGHFVGNINTSAFTLTNTNKQIVMDINQGCILTYKVTSGGPLLNAKLGGKCFPATATVHTAAGTKSISALKLGDQVLTVLSSGKVAFESVFMFSHRDAAAIAEFVVLKTASGHSISATPGHYLWASKGSVELPSACSSASNPENSSWPGFISNQGAQMLKAAELTIGDFLWVLSDAADNQLTPAEVTSVQRQLGTGLYNPHTPSGSILVDGVAALSFTETLPRSTLLHSIVTGPALALHSVLPTETGEWLNSRLLQAFSP